MSVCERVWVCAHKAEPAEARSLEDEGTGSLNHVTVSWKLNWGPNKSNMRSSLTAEPSLETWTL